MFAAISVLITLAALAAGSFGGGGGGGGSSPNSAAAPGVGAGASNISASYIVNKTEADIYRSDEYRQQWGLEAIHAAEAYAALAKNGKVIAGEGVKIAVTDTGVEANHRDISANLDSAQSYNYYDNNNNYADSNGRGTYSASIAVGVKNDAGIHGVAYNSQIIAAEVLNSAATEVDLNEAVSGAASISGVKIINASWKYSNPSGSYYTSYNGTVSGTNANDNLIIDGLRIAKNNDILFVAATGNDADNAANGQDAGQDSAYLTRLKPIKPALFANNDELAGYVLAVAAVDEFDPYATNPTITIADFSNICGVTRNYCLVAPGVNVYAASSNTNIVGGVGSADAKYAVIDETAAAAAHVSGAAAVIRAAWPHLTAPQVAQILLQTATHLGTSSATTADQIYGFGLLNLYAAVQAQGSNNLGYGLSVSDIGYDVRNSSFIADPIFGDAFRNAASSLNKAIFFDDFGRDYKAFLGNKISLRRNSTSAVRLDTVMLNNYKTNIIPLNFSVNNSQFLTQLKFQVKSYSNNKRKFVVIDNSQEDLNLQDKQGFSLRQNLINDWQFGFTFNVDEVKNSTPNKMDNFGFISTSSFSNSFQSLASSASSLSRNFNQIFIDKKLNKKFHLSFWQQNNYENSNRQNQISDLGISYQLNAKTNLAFSLGRMNEFDNNFLNSKTAGAFENQGLVKTSYFKISATQKLYKDFFAIGNISEGSTQLAGNAKGIFRNYSNIKSRAWMLGFVNENALQGKIGVLYSEPLRVYSGKAKIDIPVALDANGKVVRYQENLSLKPQGHERNFEFFYARDLNKNMKISFNLLLTKDAGNVKSDKNYYLGMVNFVSWF